LPIAHSVSDEPGHTRLPALSPSQGTTPRSFD
jgi:hypothetical protein